MTYYTDKRFKIIDAKKEKNRLWRVWNQYFNNNDEKILDAGCSVGNFISLSPEKIIGIDIDISALDICKKKRDFNAQYMDLNKSLKFPDNYFNAIYSNHSIEHTENPIFTLKEFYRVLKPNGKLILFVPNVLRYKFEIFNEYTHKHFFTPKSLEEIIYNAGFRNFKIHQEYKSIIGLGILSRKGINILKIQNVLSYLKITSKDMIAEVQK